MMKTIQTLAILALYGAVACSVQAQVTVTQGSSAPVYSNTLNFDEPGTPTGVVPANTWAPLGISDFNAGDGQPVVGDFTANAIGGPWVGTGNSFFGNFGVFMTFDSDLTAFSADVWDPSGPPSPFGGGLGVFVFDNGVEVTNSFGEPAWGGLGDQAWDISTAGGAVFDEVRSWVSVFRPQRLSTISPGKWFLNRVVSLLVLGAAMVIRRRRRRPYRLDNSGPGWPFNGPGRDSEHNVGLTWRSQHTHV